MTESGCGCGVACRGLLGGVDLVGIAGGDWDFLLGVGVWGGGAVVILGGEGGGGVGFGLVEFALGGSCGVHGSWFCVWEGVSAWGFA